MAEAEIYEDPLHLTFSGPQKIKFNGAWIGWCKEVDPTNLKLILKEIRVPVLGNIVVDHVVLGIEGLLNLDLQEPVLDLAQKLAWGWTSGNVPLSPRGGTRLYPVAKAMIIHPRELADSVTTHDRNFLKAVALCPWLLKRDGEQVDHWPQQFFIYPNMADLATGVTYGDIGTPAT
jgi:hypothetical protein